MFALLPSIFFFTTGGPHFDERRFIASKKKKNAIMRRSNATLIDLQTNCRLLQQLDNNSNSHNHSNSHSHGSITTATSTTTTMQPNPYHSQLTKCFAPPAVPQGKIMSTIANGYGIQSQYHPVYPPHAYAPYGYGLPTQHYPYYPPNTYGPPHAYPSHARYLRIKGRCRQ